MTPDRRTTTLTPTDEARMLAAIDRAEQRRIDGTPAPIRATTNNEVCNGR